MNVSFGLPAMLGGALLVGVPILIHLLNRRRYRIVPLATLRFLQEAFAQQRRRLRLENLLLLVLRCLLVLLAALAMALPFVPEDSPLAIVAGGRSELVLLVDRSGSMGRLAGPGLSLDDRVLASVRRRVGALSAERGDAVTIVALGSGPALLAPIGATPAMALAALDGPLPPPGGVADLVAAARLLKERVRPARPGRLEVVLYSDLTALSWRESGEGLTALFGAAFADGGGSLRVVPAAADLPAPANAGVVDLSAERALLFTGEALAFTATVRNWSTSARPGLSVRFLLDGVQQSVQVLDLPPLGTAAATVRVRLDVPGPHHLAVQLDADELPFDDERTLAFEARQRVAVLVVDGSPGGAEPLRGAGGWLSLALDPGGLPVRFEPQVVDVARFEELVRDLRDVDAIVLANVGGVSAGCAAALGEAVAGGTPLLVFFGDQLEPVAWNDALPWLPAHAGEARGDPSASTGEDYVTLVLPEPAPEPLALFADPRLAVLLQAPVLAWRTLTPREDGRVLASFADALGRTEPALVEGRHGRGRVALFATSADARWSLLPRQPALWVPFVHELLAWLVAPDPQASNLPVGQAPALVVDGVPVSAQLTWPGRETAFIERPQAEPLGASGARRTLLRLDGTPLDEAGAFWLSITTAGSDEPRTVALAAQHDAREGDLTPVADETLAAALAGLPWELGEDLGRGDAAAATAGDGGLASALLWALLAAALAEALLARRLGAPR